MAPLVVRPELCACVAFARHDLLRAAPLGRMDLITYRNTLLYFTPEVRAHVLDRLHQALRRGGVLGVDVAESPDQMSGLFTPEPRRAGVGGQAECP